MRVELKILEEYEFNNAMEFIKFFKLEEIVRDLWNIPKDTPIEDWEYSKYGLFDEEIISTLLEFMEGAWTLDCLESYGEIFFVVRKLSPTTPVEFYSQNKILNPSFR